MLDPSRMLGAVATIGGCLTLVGLLNLSAYTADPPAVDEPAAATAISPATNLEEAGARARLLHEAFHGALLAVHRDFFDDDDPGVLPSQSLNDVFAELGKTAAVELRWLTGNADEMSPDHRPRGDFETAAIEHLRKGATAHDALIDGELQFVGRIRLASQCLKCHVKSRRTLEDRFSALKISVPTGAPENDPSR